MSIIKILKDITREKDLYTITNEKGRHTTYNCATGEMRGISGKILKKSNQEIRTLCYCLNSSKELTDRLISLKYFDQRGRELITSYKSDILLKRWKYVVGYLREYHDKPYKSNHAYIEFQEYYIDHLPMRHNLNKDLEKALERWRNEDNDIINIVNNRKLTKLMNDSYKKALEYINIVNKYSDVCANRDETDYPLWIVQQAYEISSLEQAYPTITGYGATVKTYLENLKYKIQAEQNRDASERFSAHQQSINLFFEDENYRINIPTSYEDCQKIADYFHNCVATYEWDRHLKINPIDRYLVTIEDKKTKKDVVCVDINVKTMRIIQYYGRFNKEAPDEVDIFRARYQHYLLTLKRD